MKSCEYCRYGKPLGFRDDLYRCMKIKTGNNVKYANDLCELFKHQRKKNKKEMYPVFDHILKMYGIK